MTRVALFAFLSLTQAGCRDVSRLHDLSRELNDALAPRQLRVALTDQIILTVTVDDSALAYGSCEAQVVVGLRVGRLLREHYPALNGLQVVNVAFAAGFEREDATSPPHLPIRLRPATVQAGLQPQDSAEAVASCRAFEELNTPG